MKYAKVHETLWEGEPMANVATNRYVDIAEKPSGHRQFFTFNCVMAL